MARVFWTNHRGGKTWISFNIELKIYLFDTGKILCRFGFDNRFMCHYRRVSRLTSLYSFFVPQSTSDIMIWYGFAKNRYELIAFFFVSFVQSIIPDMDPQH